MDFTSKVAVAVDRTPKGALLTALTTLNMPLHLEYEVERIIIKPSIYNPAYPGNTNIELVEGLVSMFRNTGRVYIVESDNPVRTAEEAFEDCGYHQLQEIGAKLVNLSKEPCHSIEMPGHFFKEREMPEILSGNILQVNVATLKQESDKRIMGASIKNLFGFLPELDKSVYHENIHDVLVDLLITYPPTLTILDLTELVTGPRSQKITKRTKGVVVSQDSVAIDAFGAHLIGIDPMTVPHIELAYNLGLGEALLDRIQVLGTEHQKKLIEMIQY
ncbi:MAG: DUF362 domain-containing protein [Candidatus Lokiarchaeota archaeon]|nr:DUF362 domain-containing protein [Candidatus Lokiarchaeota archaeon]